MDHPNIRPSLSQRALAIALIGLLATPSALFARVQPTTGRNMYSPDQEVQIGKEAAAQTNKQLPILPDSDPLSRYVQQLGAKLVAHAPGDKWPYNFHVVNQKEINAFALPGGPIYVNVGTIQAADNEAELAGVMAHEISHVVQRHATRAATKAQLPSTLLGLAGAVLGGSSAGKLAVTAAQFGAGAYFLKNSRQAETEADLLGTDIMYDTGYNPQAMADFFDKLKAEGGARAPQFLSDHPDPGNRVQKVQAELETLPPRSSYLGDSSGFANAKRLAAGMKPLTAQEIAQAQKQGTLNSGSSGSGSSGGSSSAATADLGNVNLNAVLPSGSVVVYEGTAFTIKHPDNWQVRAGDGAVNIAPAAGASGGNVAYGVVISGVQPQSNSLDDTTRQIVQGTIQGNSGMRQVGGMDEITVNRVHGRSVDLVGTSPVKTRDGRSLPEKDWLVTLPLSNGQVLYAVFVAPDDGNYNRFRTAFENMLRSLHVK
jgi:Zn-dependent protease with chaperone function